MAGTTVRVSSRTAKILKEITVETGKSMQKVLDQAVEEHRRTLFLKEVNEAYFALKSNPEEWNDELKEREDWSATLIDGQGDDYQ